MSTLAEALAIFTLSAGQNTAVVMLGAAALGAAAGVVGTFAVRRGRALVSDALAHATLPGVGLGFLAALALGFPGRSPAFLLGGAALTALLAALLIQAARRRTRLAEDAIVAAVLAGFFALGVVLLSVIQTLPTGGQAGLDSYLLGATAGMLEAEARGLALVAVLVIAAVAILFKDLAAAAFDPVFTTVAGLDLRALDLVVTALVLVVVAAGLPVVGLVLVVALIVGPPAAARFWSDRLATVTLISGAIGAASAYAGAGLSALAPDLPTGALIVLVVFAAVVASALFGAARGVVVLRFRTGGVR